jgi:translation initiation factor IF-3
MIRIPQVRVIDEEGNQLGIMPTARALEMAQERGLDLVEVAPMAAPPVTRFLDFGQYKYELTKREKEAKKRQRVGFKEVRLSPKIGSGDFETKVHRAVEFLSNGDRLKVTVRFRGRELTHPELGRALLERFGEQIREHGAIERAPVLEGKSMFVTVASSHKPKLAEAGGRPGGGGNAAASTAGPAAGQAAPASEAPASETPAPAPKARATARPPAAPAAPAQES